MNLDYFLSTLATNTAGLVAEGIDDTQKMPNISEQNQTLFEQTFAESGFCVSPFFHSSFTPAQLFRFPGQDSSSCGAAASSSSVLSPSDVAAPATAPSVRRAEEVVSFKPVEEAHQRRRRRRRQQRQQLGAQGKQKQ